MTAVPALRHGDFRLVDLRLPEEVVRDCARAGILSIADLLATSESPAAVEVSSYETARAAAERFAAQPLPLTGAVPLDRKLDEVVTAARALKAFRQVGATTVGQFLACPREELLAVRDFGAKTWRTAVE